MDCISITNLKKLHKFTSDEEYKDNVKTVKINNNLLKYCKNIKNEAERSYKRIKLCKNIKITCYCDIISKYKNYNNYFYVLDPYACKNIKYINNCCIDTLELNNCKNIKDVGNLYELKKLIIKDDNTQIYQGIHLLKNLEELILIEDHYNKIKGQIKKLIETNKTIIIKFTNKSKLFVYDDRRWY
jgi:hypothetical protein